MRKAYIILAHKNADQLKRLIDRLDDGHSRFFIHIDLRSAMQKNKALFHDNGHVTMLRPTATIWGGFGLVQVTLNALSAIKQHGDFHRIILLSGQDYPIKSNIAIDEFFENSEASNFMQWSKLPDYSKWPADGGSYRINKYYFGPSFIAKYMAKAFNFLSLFIKMSRRKLKLVVQYFHGSQWWILDMRAVNYILDFVNLHPAYSLFHRYTFAPDEVFFQTILLNANDDLLKASIANNSKRFMKWSCSDSAHPETLNIEDADDIKNSTDLFARKFDGDTVILDIVDRDCLNYKGR